MIDTSILDARLYRTLVEIDQELGTKMQARGCPHCGGKLHSAQYPRKPRGWPAGVAEIGGETRLSYCCAVCRRRTTPASVRFLGRRIYSAAVMVMGSMSPGRLSAKAARPLCEALKVPKRTLERWRQWWRQGFVKTPQWVLGQARFMPPLEPQELPSGFIERFQGDDFTARLVRCLRFLTTTWESLGGHLR